MGIDRDTGTDLNLSPQLKTDESWMHQALALADQAESLGEVPVGAVVVRDGEVIGEGYNCPISQHDPTAHAEIQALRHAADQVRNYRLLGCTLFVTIEPCTMCVGALVHARIERLVFGAREPKAGAVVSQSRLLDTKSLNHRISVTDGVLAEECGERLSQFFTAKRNKSSGQV